jgi:hypothetical protein
MAEDGGTERPSLEECIAGVFTAKPREIGRELVERLRRFTDKMLSGEVEMPMGKPSMIPKTVSASSQSEHENKGESMSGIFHVDTEDTITDEEQGDGMRTERVVVEIEHSGSGPIDLDDLALHLRTRLGQFVGLRINPESVRVVPESEGVSWKQVCDEGERISREEGYKILMAEIEASHAERDALAARVVELEGTVKESLTVAAPAAEPVAWMCEWTDHAECYESKAHAERAAAGDVVPQPLYASPPPAKAWLTGEERGEIEEACENLEEFCGDLREDIKAGWVRIINPLRALLARNEPPRVKLPPAVHKDILAALAAAGVKVQE